MLTRIISIILICSLVLVPTSVFASSGPGAPWDATYNWYNVGSDGSGDMNNGNVLYGLSQISRSLMWIGQWIYSNNSTVQNIYNLLSSSNFFQYVTQYLSSIANDTSVISTRLNNIYSLMQTNTSLQTSQLTQLQQINTKLDTINSVKWTNLNSSFDGISSNGLSFINEGYLAGNVLFSKVTFYASFTKDVIMHIRLPIRINIMNSLKDIYLSDDRLNGINLIAYKQNYECVDIYLRLDKKYPITSLNFVFEFYNNGRLDIGSNLNYLLVEYLLYTDPNFYTVLNALTDLYYLDQISNKLDNIEVSVDTTDIVEAINALDITQDIDVDISQDINQTTNLITQLRNLFGTGVSIPQFVQQTQDQSFLGWFSQSNSDDINHISTGYNEAPY